MKTYTVKESEVLRDWYVVDAAGQTLGRLSSQVAAILRGKHKPTFSPHIDLGDFVVIVNAEKVAVTGKRAEDKMYYHYSGYAGGMNAGIRQAMQDRQEAIFILNNDTILAKNCLNLLVKKLYFIFNNSMNVLI